MKIKEQSISKDIQYALILGIIIGVFLLPMENNFFVGDKFFIHTATFFAAPLLALAGIVLCRWLFSSMRGFWQFSKFFLVGVSNTAINFGVFNFFIYFTGITTGFGLNAIAAAAFLAAIVNSYIWNMHWTFKDQRKHVVIIGEFERFSLVTLTTMFISSFAVFVINHFSALGTNANMFQAEFSSLVAITLSMLCNFFGYKYFVFKHKD